MTKLIEVIKKDTITSMKNGEKEKLSTLRMLVAELEKEKISKKLTEVNELSNEDVERVISGQIKKLDKEIESYLAVDREVDNQNKEKEILLSYLPKQLTEEEIRQNVEAFVNSTKDNGMTIGEAMKQLSAKLKGKADMKIVSKNLKELI